jgi:hypothetical protein
MSLVRVKSFSLGWLGVIFILSLLGNLRANAGWPEDQTLRVKAEEDSSNPIYFPVALNDMVGPPNGLQTVFGLEMSGITNKGGLQQVRDANTSFIRYNGIRWGDVEPEEGQRNWSALSEAERHLRTAAQSNLHVVLVVRYTPSWAQKLPGATCGPVRQDKLKAFGDFMYDLVIRYSQSPYYIKHWEIWNEPDVDSELAMRFGSQVPFGCWGDPADDFYGGRYYAEMLKVIYPRIKQADPEAQILVGGLLMSCNPASGSCTSDLDRLASRFFEGILANQGGDYFDGVAFHNYDTYRIGRLGQYSSPKWNSSWDTTGPALIAKADFLNALLETYNVSGKYLMNTESAILCGGFSDPPGGPGCEPDPDSLFEKTKAYYVAQSYAAAAALGMRTNIWYNLSGWRNSGLIYSDLSPRPAYTAFQFSRSMLGEVAASAALTTQDTGDVSEILGYKFQHPDGRVIWVIWSKDGKTQTVALPSPPSGVWDTLGNAQTLANSLSLSVTLEPLYVEWGP